MRNVFPRKLRRAGFYFSVLAQVTSGLFAGQPWFGNVGQKAVKRGKRRGKALNFGIFKLINFLIS